MKSRSILIPAAKVRPGQEFQHYGIEYVRATDDETAGHPGQEQIARRNRPLVLAYQPIGERQRQPVSFVPEERVVVRSRPPKHRKG